MKGPAVLLLFVFLLSAEPIVSSAESSTIQEQTSTARPSVELSTSTAKVPDYLRPLADPTNVLLQEIRSLEKDVSNDKIGEEVAKAFKAEAQKSKPSYYRTSTTPRSAVSTNVPTARIVSKINGKNATSDRASMLELDDMAYEDDLADEDEEDEDDEDDDEYDEDDASDDEIDDDEEVMTQCPDYCKCAGQYAAATTATCSKLVEEQTFGPSIAHLRIENAGEITLGPHALRAKGLQHLESITIVDTTITEIDRTAFDGISSLFAVNLTRNGLQDIHPHTFQNNTQLSLLTIAWNPLRHAQYFKPSKHYLLDAPSITELDFSNNGIPRLPRTAFSKMQSLGYVNLKGNRLKEIDRAIFSPLESLVELDLSYNMLSELPLDLFDDRDLQTLHITGNNLTTLTTIKASKLTSLDVSNNKIRVIAKDDLIGMPSLDQLTIRSNGLKRIHQHAFSNFDQLMNLDISDNKLTSLTEHHFRNNPRLQVLLMSDNPDLNILPVFKTSGLEYNTYSIYRFDCAYCGLVYLEEGTFDEMPALIRLNLARNRLSGLPNRLFSQLSSLRDLDLSDNIITSLDARMFEGATSLSKLSLAGNPLVTLQVTPFLMTPGLSRLDVSRCALERVWSEARVPLKNLRFLSVRGNLLHRITLEELRATPKLSGLDLTHNPLDCDDEFSEAVQWLTNHGITPTETLKYISNYVSVGNYTEEDGISQWTDLAKVVCANMDDSPATRPAPHKPEVELRLTTLDDSLLTKDLDGDEGLLALQFDHGVQRNEELENAWSGQDQEYEEYSPSVEYPPWYSGGALWPVVTVIVVTLAVLLLVAHIAVCLAKRRGRGPVIRPPMMLRQGLIDNKNCGLVYKPLQEEIATPHMPKRGSFYSSSTFHYDKIVPESV